MDSQRADEFLKILVSAYVWVASADEGVDLLEYHKYEHVMVQSQFATQFNEPDMRTYFKDMVALFANNFDEAVALTKTRLKLITKQELFAEEVIRICRAAAVGDGKLSESEEVVLAEIGGLLGIEK